MVLLSTRLCLERERSPLSAGAYKAPASAEDQRSAGDLHCPRTQSAQPSHRRGAHVCYGEHDQHHGRSWRKRCRVTKDRSHLASTGRPSGVVLGYPVAVWQLNLAALLAVLFVAFVGFSFSGPFVPLLVRHLGVTEPRAVAHWSGVLMGLGPLSAVVASPLWGRLADRIGGRLLLLRTVLGFAALNALSAMATDVWQLAMLRLLMGALGGFTAVALTLASLSVPPERTTRAIALVQSAQILGQMVGPIFGGLLADHWGIRAAFWGSSGLAVVAGVNMLLMYQESPASMQQRRQRRTGGTTMRFRDILGTTGFVPILLVLFVGTFTQRSYQPLIPLFVASTGAAPGTVASVTGLIVAGGALAATLSTTLASRLVASLPHAQVLVLSLIHI